MLCPHHRHHHLRLGVTGDVSGWCHVNNRKNHEAHTQAAVRSVPHAGPGLHLLLLWEAPPARLGPKAT